MNELRQAAEMALKYFEEPAIICLGKEAEWMRSKWNALTPSTCRARRPTYR
jgi:hypothetical protein